MKYILLIFLAVNSHAASRYLMDHKVATAILQTGIPVGMWPNNHAIADIGTQVTPFHRRNITIVIPNDGGLRRMNVQITDNYTRGARTRSRTYELLGTQDGVFISGYVYRVRYNMGKNPSHHISKVREVSKASREFAEKWALAMKAFTEDYLSRVRTGADMWTPPKDYSVFDDRDLFLGTFTKEGGD